MLHMLHEALFTLRDGPFLTVSLPLHLRPPDSGLSCIHSMTHINYDLTPFVVRDNTAFDEAVGL